MNPALQYEMQRPPPDDHLALTETMDQCILAYEVGFGYLWLVGYCFLTGFSSYPCISASLGESPLKAFRA